MKTPQKSSWPLVTAINATLSKPLAVPFAQRLTRACAFLVLLMLTHVGQADVYETITGGPIAYESPSSWVGGVVPPNPIEEEDVVIIHGDLTMGPGSFTNSGSFIVTAAASLEFKTAPSAGYVFFNTGQVFIDGTMISLEGTDPGAFSQVFNFGVFDLNGFWENSTGFDNTGITLIQPGSLFRNWTSTPAGCVAGDMINNVDIFQQGGTIDSSECGGGISIGGPPVSGSCGAPHAVIAYVDQFGDLHLRWSKRPGTAGYKVGGQVLPSGPRKTMDVSASTNEIVIPSGSFPTGVSLQYGAHSFCTAGVFNPFNLTLSTMDLMTRPAGVVGQEFSAILVEEKISGRTLNPIVSIYPNPVSSTLSINLQQQFEESYFVEISELSGRKVISSPSLKGSNTAIDVSGLASGTYLLSVHSASGVHAQLLVVE